jgi:predicted membrane protein (TIGR00267 family)
VLYRKNQKYWVDFMMNNELKIADPRNDSPLYSGFATFLAFITFGVIPLIPFLLMEAFHQETIFFVSAAGTFTALILLGFFKGKIAGGSLMRSILEVVLIGEAAAFVAFVIGSLFTLA